MNRRSMACSTLAPIAFLFFLAVPAHGQQTSTPPAQETPFVFSPPNTIIYVSDFDLDAQNFQADQGRTKIVQRPSIIEGPRKQEQDPQAEAKKLVDLMATEIVKDLNKAGYKAQRLTTTTAHPSSGVWVHGVFTELDEGNRIHRAVIGFGSGAATMQLYVTMNDLSHPDQPLYNISQSADSGKQPGAAITMNPYVAAAKFVMSKDAPEKTIKKTASDIAAEIITHLKKHESPAASK